MAKRIRLSPYQIKEASRCAIDPEYFGNNYCWLEREASGEVLPYNVLPFQAKLIRNFLNMVNTVVNKSRRVGWSWAIALFVAWVINFVPSTKVLILSRRESDAVEVLNKVKFVLDNLRHHDAEEFYDCTSANWLKGEIIVSNRTTLTRAWRNPDGSIRETSTVVSLTNTDQSGRGAGAKYLFMDEFAFYEHDWLTWRSISKTIIGGGMWACGSSPNGIGNKFHQLVSKAILGENVDENGERLYEFMQVHWSESWISEAEVEADKATSTDEDAAQEWELEFLSSGNAVFDPAHLAVCYKPIEEYPEIEKELKRYHKRVLNGKDSAIYYSGADTMIGKIDRKSKEKDYHAFCAWTEHGIQAHAYTSQESLASWAGQNIPIGEERYESIGTLSKLHKDYPGVLAIEEQGGGVTAINNHVLPDDGFSVISPFHTTAITQMRDIGIMKVALSSQSIVITDFKTYQQLQILQDNGPGPRRFAAPAGSNDDAAWAAITGYSKLAREGVGDMPFEGDLTKLERESESGKLISQDLVDAIYGPGLISDRDEEYNPYQWGRQADTLDNGVYRPPDIYDYINERDIPDVVEID